MSTATPFIRSVITNYFLTTDPKKAVGELVEVEDRSRCNHYYYIFTGAAGSTCPSYKVLATILL